MLNSKMKESLVVNTVFNIYLYTLGLILIGILLVQEMKNHTEENILIMF